MKFDKKWYNSRVFDKVKKSYYFIKRSVRKIKTLDLDKGKTDENQ
jgi:hypothetical protein